MKTRSKLNNRSIVVYRGSAGFLLPRQNGCKSWTFFCKEDIDNLCWGVQQIKMFPLRHWFWYSTIKNVNVKPQFWQWKATVSSHASFNIRFPNALHSADTPYNFCAAQMIEGGHSLLQGCSVNAELCLHTTATFYSLMLGTQALSSSASIAYISFRLR